MDNISQGAFDSPLSAEEFINVTIEKAKEKNLTVNDVKLALKIVESVAERSEFNPKKISLTFSMNNWIGFLFE